MGYFDNLFSRGNGDDDPRVKKPESPKKSPEVRANLNELLRGEFREAVFPDNFFGRPKELPESFKEVNCNVPNFGELSGYSDYGGDGSKYESENQDAMVVVFSADGKKLLLSVIDGVGGMSQGRRAATVCVEGLVEAMKISKLSLPDLMQLANDKIREDGSGGETTGVGVLIEEGGLVTMIGIGDSKAMTVRRGEVLSEGKTKMQNVAAYFHGENTPGYYSANNNHIITNSLGGEDVLRSVELVSFQGEEGDVIVLASDALWDVMSEYEVQQIVNSSRNGGVLQIRKNIFDEVYRRNSAAVPFKIDCGNGKKVDMDSRDGDGDNISIQVIELRGLKSSEKKKGDRVERKGPALVVDRKPLLCSSGDLLWLKNIMKMGDRWIPVRRSSGEWGSGKIAEIDGDSMTAKIDLGKGLCYKAVPLEVVLGWLKETGNDTKEKDLMPVATKESIMELRRQTLEAVRSSGLVAFFQEIRNNKGGIRLRVRNGDGVLEWKDCLITNVDVKGCEINYRTRDALYAGTMPMSLAFSYVKEAEWRH